MSFCGCSSWVGPGSYEPGQVERAAVGKRAQGAVQQAMRLVVVGANHRTAPIEVRERFSFGRTEVPAVLSHIAGTGVVSEVVLLSTCNRTELYVVAPDEEESTRVLASTLADRLGASVEEARRYLYVHRGERVAEHLYRVAAGLESMVLGEPQIQGQVREAYGLAREVVIPSGGIVGVGLNRLFQSALHVGGRIRTETEIGLGAASVSSAAVDLAKKIFGSLRGRRALVLGAGEMSEVTLECLRAEGVLSAMVTNRTHARAEEMAGRWGGEAIHFDDFERALPNVDIVICSTAAPHPVLTRERFRRALPHGAARPLCIIDIAIPRDVEPVVGDEAQVFLYNIDDLQQIVDANLGRRRSQLPHAEAIIAQAAQEYWGWYTSLDIVPTIRDLRSRSEEVRQAELERMLRRMSHLAPEDQQAIDAMTRALLNKLLHTPTVRLREAASNGRGTAVLDTVRYLFELDHSVPVKQEPDL
jgi:glutamyl-tRNA reductase